MPLCSHKIGVLRRVIDAQALKKCRDYLATTSTFFGGNPPFKGRGVPKKAHILRTTLQYGLHRANVLSGELAKPRRRPKVLQNARIANEMKCTQKVRHKTKCRLWSIH